ncbi:MAG: phosphate ABC transporter permease PstA [Gammaproteobacteria bacterium]|nr:phosphate ABC transporter permease PstA [Gammaproteobacteria bacterium]MDD9850166.1 phosphate ABC transporter permease PstA [Gammaproteobacteria bacterium]
MNDASQTVSVVRAGLHKRRAAERRFRLAGAAAVAVAALFIAFLFTVIVKNGLPGLWQTRILLTVELPAAEFQGRGEAALKGANYRKMVRQSLLGLFPDATTRGERRAAAKLLSEGAPYQVRRAVLADPDLAGGALTLWLPAASSVDIFHKSGAGGGKLSGWQKQKVAQLQAAGRLRTVFHRGFFLNNDSRSPELAGIRGALAGTFYTLLVTLMLSFPVGVAAACYLEEFAPRNRWTDLAEISINNLAAVPSVVFGLLGLAVFINFFGLPRSVPLVGGLVLSLMTLPTIIIAARAALRSVPLSIRQAALGMGASKMQTLFHHVLPLSLPGILTGTIIGMAQALGESAPLLMTGMVAFLVNTPGGVLDPATVLPVQVFLWADSPERGFVEKTSAAILVLIGFLVAMNLLAVIIRAKFQKRW